MKCENCHTFIDYENLTTEVINEAEKSLLEFLSKTGFKIKKVVMTMLSEDTFINGYLKLFL